VYSLRRSLSTRYEVGESLTAAPRPTGGRGIDYGFIGTLDAETRRQRAEEVGYEIRDTWVDPREAAKEIAPVTLEGGHLATALGEIRALRVDAPEGTTSTAVGLVFSFLISDNHNNMPPRRSSATARAAATTAAPMTAAAVE
ncbi:hypothetical protein Tco_0865449, partial [Tanacetum coccineum]